MTTTVWASFAPLMTMRLPGCPAFSLEDACRWAAIEFYRTSRAWREAKTTLTTTVAAQANYTITNTAGQEMCGLPAVWVNDVEVGETLPGAANDHYIGEKSDTFTVGVTGGTTITLTPPPVSAGLVIDAEVAYQPTESSTGIPDYLFYKHREAIVEKALAELMKQKNKDWSDPNMAILCEAKYNIKANTFSSDNGPLRRTPLRVRLSAY